MKKHLIAAAVATAVAAPAMAQNVTITGILKPGYEYAKRTGQNAQGQIEDQSSRIIIGGSEDLGGGLKAIFQVDTRFAFDNNTATQTAAEVGNGNTWLGMTGGFGELRVGKHDLHYNEAGALIDGGLAGQGASNLESSAGSGLLSQVQGNAVAVTSRTANLVKYDSPKFMNALQFGAAYSTAFAGADGAGGATGAAKTNGGSATNFVVRYASGPLSAVASQWNAKAEDRTVAAGNDEKATTVGGRYDFGAFQIGAVWNQSARKTVAGVRTERTGWGVGLDYPLSANLITHFTYAQVGSIEVDNVTTANSGADHTTLGVSYLFSKRTSAGLYWTKLDNNTAGTYTLFSNSTGTVTAGDTISSFYAGLRHTF